MGEERPSEVHGGGGEGSATNAEKESDADTQDVLGAVTKGAEVVGSEGLLGLPVPQRHVLGFILIYSFGFDVFGWYWLLFVKSLSFI